MKLIVKTSLFIFLFLTLSPITYCQELLNDSSNRSASKIFILDIKEEIAPPVWHKIKEAFKQAKEVNASAILANINTYGGMVNIADSIRTLFLESPIPIYAFINNNAASAGALISIACDSIYMRPGSNIGAATVVNQAQEVLPDKYQSYMRSMMRSTAETKGRDPKIAEAMVDESIEIEDIIEKDKILTFTSKEAIKHGFCEGEFNSIEEIITHLGFEKESMTFQTFSYSDRIIGFLIHPMVSGLLIMLIIGGIYFEIQTPGIGFPLALAISCALLYFMPLYIEGLASHWEILLFIIGVILIALEIFVIPGFGVAGISGIILLVLGLSLSLIDNQGWNLDADSLYALIKSVALVVASTITAIIASFFISKNLFTSSRLQSYTLQAVQDTRQGYSSSDTTYAAMIGHSGITQTVLRPAGKVIINENIFDAYSDDGFIEKGEKIIVSGYNNTQLKIRKANNEKELI